MTRPIERSAVVTLRVSSEERAMLEALVDVDRLTASDVLRRLIVSAYRTRFGDRLPPRQEQIRRRLDELGRRDDVHGDLRAQAVRTFNRRKEFDKTHPPGLALGAEETAYEVLEAAEDAGFKRGDQNKLKDAMHELESFYMS